MKSLKCHYRWTLKHSFYGWMGGFVLFIDRDPALPREVYYPLTPDELLEFLKADLVQMSMVSEKDIDDRSKGDWLSKTVAVMQLVWFVVQLAARASIRLPTTQLEIDALAISILSCFTYAFWWHKPKDARRPVPVYWKEPGELPEIEYRYIQNSIDSTIFDQILLSAPQSIDEFQHQFGLKENWIGNCFGYVLRPLLNLGGIQYISDAAVKAHRVPYLCGYPPDVDRETFGQLHLPISFIGALAGMVFGGIHCIAWNSTFPTHTEKIVWRVASLATVAMPGLALTVMKYCSVTADAKPIPHASIKASSSLIIAFLYVSCRLILMVLTILSLRSLPDGVYDEVCWTIPIPHW